MIITIWTLMENNFIFIKEKYYNDLGNHYLATIVVNANIITYYKSTPDITNFAKMWEHTSLSVE